VFDPLLLISSKQDVMHVARQKGARGIEHGNYWDLVIIHASSLSHTHKLHHILLARACIQGLKSGGFTAGVSSGAP
jgi:hypothetical protein